MALPVFPYAARLTPADRSRLMPHRPAALWFTGLSGSGKSTLADTVEVQLHQEYGAHTFLLDGDSLRHGLNRDLGFSDADRAENVRRVGEVARLMTDAGLIVLAALISPFRADRDWVRALFPPGVFFEIFVDCPLAVCEQRDPKALYRAARAGQLPGFTGVSAPYEPPLQPEVTVDTSQLTPAAAAAVVLAHLAAGGVITPR